MATYTDAFTDTDGTALASHLSDQGNSWVNHVISGSNAAAIQNNRVQTSTNGASIYYLNVIPASNDYDVECQIVHNGTGADTGGLVGRLSTSSADMYIVAYVNTFSQWQLYRYVGGLPSLIGSYSGDSPSGTTRTVRLSMTGTTIRVLIDPVQRISVTDSFITTGRGGLAVSATVGIENDAFQLIDSAPPPAPTNGTPSVSVSGQSVTVTCSITSSVTPTATASLDSTGTDYGPYSMSISGGAPTFSASYTVTAVNPDTYTATVVSTNVGGSDSDNSASFTIRGINGGGISPISIPPSSNTLMNPLGTTGGFRDLTGGMQ